MYINNTFPFHSEKKHRIKNPYGNKYVSTEAKCTYVHTYIRLHVNLTIDMIATYVHSQANYVPTYIRM